MSFFLIKKKIHHSKVYTFANGMQTIWHLPSSPLPYGGGGRFKTHQQGCKDITYNLIFTKNKYTFLVPFDEKIFKYKNFDLI